MSQGVGLASCLPKTAWPSDFDEIASEAVKNHIKQIVAAEDPKRPHSDQKIVEILKGQGIEIARRTVAKYRNQLKIEPSHIRKRKSIMEERT